MTDQLSQYKDATTNLAVFALGPRGQIQLSGADRLSFLHNFCTNDIKRLSPGEGCEAFLTNIKGRIIGHFIASANHDTLWLDSEPETSEFITSHLDKYVITEDVLITDLTADRTSLLLIGPQTESWLASHTDGFTGLSICGQVTIRLAGIDCTLRRVPFTAWPSVEIICEMTEARRLQLMFADVGITTIGRDTFESLRIESGFPRYGVDITDANIAQEAGRTQEAISFKKGCYLGQEPIARLDALGHVNKQLRTLHIEGSGVPSPGTAVTLNNGEEAGQITSATLSPSTGQPIALAMLRTSAGSSNTKLFVGTATATLLPKPAN